jgi:hypothetical protein
VKVVYLSRYRLTLSLYLSGLYEEKKQATGLSGQACWDNRYKVVSERKANDMNHL